MNATDKPKTARAVTKFIRANSQDQQVELRRGDGYWFFTGGRADEFHQQGVYVYRIGDMTFGGWLKEYQERVLAL